MLGAFFAVIVILIFLSGRVNGKYKLSWRATLIVALSIPTSVLFAILLMWLLPVTVGQQFETIRDGTNSSFLRAVLSLIPAFVTLNIMTLSGLTVAIGRVVDDSIVVLENSYRYIQKGHDPEQAVFQGTQEVAVAIFRHDYDHGRFPAAGSHWRFDRYVLPAVRTDCHLRSGG